MIIDAHAHLGWDEAFDENFTAEALCESQQRNAIDVTLVQPATTFTLSTVQRQHDAIAELARRHPGHFYGIANPCPHLPEADYAGEVNRCIAELGFVGIKLHPYGQAVNPLGQHGRRVFAVAQSLQVPVMVHTGAGLPWSAPALLAPVAEVFPDLPLVVAHAGGMICAGEAGQLAARFPNVYLEPSWTGGFLIKHWAAELGADRLMFGSDHADNAATELAKYRSMDFSTEQLDFLLGGTARSVFRLP